MRFGNSQELFPDNGYASSPFGIDFSSLVPSVGFSAGANPVGAIESGVPGFATAVDSAPAGTSMLDIIKLALGTWQVTQQQKSFLKVNEQLIQQGQPPVAWNQFAPTANVGVAIDPNTRTMMYILGGGVIAVLAAMALKKR